MLTVLEPCPVEPERLARFVAIEPKRIDFTDAGDAREPRGAAAGILSDVCKNGDGRPRAAHWKPGARHSLCAECQREKDAATKRAWRRRNAAVLSALSPPAGGSS